jgi:predicted nucleic acid-binding protein
MIHIVVDADIMRAAGLSEKPAASHARQILETIQKSGHSIVMAKPLIKEYKKHQSGFSELWKGQMVRKRQVVRDENYRENRDLRTLLIQQLPADNHAAEAAVLKDAHLLEIALTHGKRIISKDKKAKKNFQFSCAVKGDHRTLLWADATERPAGVIEWIANGCADQNEWRLCPKPSKPAAKKSKK